MKLTGVSPLVLTLLPLLAGSTAVSAQPPIAKAAVGEKIRMVENGVDEFRNYLERRGENARERGSSAQAQAAQSGRAARRGGAANTEARKAAASEGKDQLNDNLDALNRSTNRLRRKFDATDKWMETKVQVEAMLDDGRKINQTVARGNYGNEVARLWAALRNQMNDLARTYGCTPLGV